MLAGSIKKLAGSNEKLAGICWFWRDSEKSLNWGQVVMGDIGGMQLVLAGQ